MAAVSGAMRPYVLPRGAFLSVPRSHARINQSAAKALYSVEHGRSCLVTSAKWNAPRAPTTASPSAGSTIEQALFSAIVINQELVSHGSRSFSVKAVAGNAPPSTAGPDIVSQEEEEAECQPEDLDNPPNWTVKFLYDGDCPLCMKEVGFLRERNKTYRTIKLVDVSTDSYAPEENAYIRYEEAMGSIHGVLRDGTVLTGVSVLKKVYDEVGLGWVYAITSIGPIGKIADAVYDLWAKYRLPMTGRPPLVEVLEARRQKKEAAECDTDRCGV